MPGRFVLVWNSGEEIWLETFRSMGCGNFVDMLQTLVGKRQHRTLGIHVILQSASTTNTSGQIRTLFHADL